VGDGDQSEEVEGVEHRWVMNQHGLGGDNLEGTGWTWHQIVGTCF
jgi:hypothetical protein